MTRLDDALLKQIAEGTGHVYRHEAKYMALELIERRAAEAKLAATQPVPQLPLWGLARP